MYPVWLKMDRILGYVALTISYNSNIINTNIIWVTNSVLRSFAFNYNPELHMKYVINLLLM